MANQPEVGEPLAESRRAVTKERAMDLQKVTTRDQEGKGLLGGSLIVVSDRIPVHTRSRHRSGASTAFRDRTIVGVPR
jgi:hypothetical protein